MQPSVQTSLGERLSDYMKTHFEVDIDISSISLEFDGTLVLEEILIKDHHKDTLISVAIIESQVLYFPKLLNKQLELGPTAITDGVFNIKTYKGEQRDNFTVFSNKLKKENKEKKNSFEMYSSSVFLHEIDLIVTNENRISKPLLGTYSSLSGYFTGIKLKGPNISTGIKEFSFVDNFGVEVTNLTSNFSYTPTRMQFLNSQLHTAHSALYFDMEFLYQLEDLKKFNEKVQIEAHFEKSSVSLKDLQKFYNQFSGSDSFVFSSDFKGKMANFRLLDFKLSKDDALLVEGNYHLTNVHSTLLDYKITGTTEQLKTNSAHLRSLFPNVLGKRLPAYLDDFGQFIVKGSTSLSPQKLQLEQFKIESGIGSATLDVGFSNLDTEQEIAYEGAIGITDLEIGSLTANTDFGPMSFEGYVNGKGFKLKKISTSLEGVITKQVFKNYTYSNIEVNGVLMDKLFNGNLHVKESNLHLDFMGLADFSSKTHQFDFKASIHHADLYALNLLKRDSIATLKGILDIDLSGNTIDDIKGQASFKEFAYKDSFDTYLFDSFSLSSKDENGVKIIDVVSNDLIKGRIQGRFRLTEIDELIQNAMGSMLTNYQEYPVTEKQYFDFDFEIYNPIVDVVFPKLHLSSSAFLKGKVIEENNEVKMLFKTEQVRFKKTLIDSVHLQIDNKNPALNTNFKIKKINMPNYVLNDINIYNKTLNDTLFFRSDFTGGTQKTERFGLSFYYTIDASNKSVIGIQKSKILLKDTPWFLNPDDDKKNKLVFDLQQNKFEFDAFKFNSGEQQIAFTGALKDTSYKDLKLNFKKVNLAEVLPKIDSLSLGGELNGNLHFFQEKGVYNPLGHLSISDLSINNALQGDVEMQVLAEDSYQKYSVDLRLINDALKSLDATGYVNLNLTKPTLDLKVALKAFQLNAFSPLGKNTLSKIRGLADGDFTLSGPIANPYMDGNLELTNSGFKFPYLNIDYSLDNSTNVKLKGQSFIFEEVHLKDVAYDTKGELSGFIRHNAFKDWEMDLDLSSERLLVLDTEDGENVPYYGKGFIKGKANFVGPTNDLTINVKATTLSGTKFVIPLSDIKAVSNSKLVHFKSVAKENSQKNLFDKELLIEKIQGVSLNFDLDVTTDAVAEVVIDRTSGSSLKGRGTSNLLIEIDTKGKFNMYGDYRIEKGIYNFIYGGIINKPFVVKKGGMISWDGDPMNANLDVQAVHSVKANPKILLNDLNTNRKIGVDLITDIDGTLFNSSESFSIEIPNSSSTVANELAFVLNENDENTTLRQFFSLLIAKSFFNEDNLASNGNAAITGTTSEIISSAISDIFNEDDDRIRIDLGYTSGEKNDVETLNIDDQVDISMKTQINDRILIDGNLGVPVGDKTQASIIGEVKVEFLVDDQGNLRYTVFSRQNEIQYSEEEEGYTQGVGLEYQIDFENLKEMFSKLGFKRKKRKKLSEFKEEEFENDLILVVPSIL